MEGRDMFKKIYVEITNFCNLNCPFCLKTSRSKHNLTFDEFKHILDEIKPYTKYLYFHVLGEPLIHPLINEFIDYASKDFYVNITTNGYLINNIKTNNIRQINVSLHSFSDKYNKDLNSYLNDIFSFENISSKDTYINYRLWVDTPYYGDIKKAIENRYHIYINDEENNIKLKDNVYLNFSHKFDWPEDNNSAECYSGVCYALKDHIAILSNGDVTACCLDGNGTLSFGNIFSDSLSNIISSDSFTNMKKELISGKRSNKLCQKCNFLFRD